MGYGRRSSRLKRSCREGPIAYALRNEGKVVGLFTNRENAEEYMREASGGPDGHDLAIDDEPMTVVAPQ